MAHLFNRTILTVIVAAMLPAVAHAQAKPARYAPGEVIVKLKNEASGQAVGQFFSKSSNEKAMRLRANFGKMNMYQFALKPGDSVEATVDQLRQDPTVEYAEPNWYLDKLSIDETVQNYSAEDIQAMGGVQAFNAFGALGTCSSEAYDGRVKPVVAVIDTGLDVSHPVFVDSGAVWQNTDEVAGNGIDDDSNGYIDDVNGWNFVANNGVMLDDDDHGTHVSGIVLSVCQDIYTYPYQQSKVQIMPLKFLDAYGVGKTSDAIKAIYYAVNNGAKVLNNSWGGSSYSGALHEAVSYAYTNGTAFIAAAGNSSVNNDVSPLYPASYSSPNMMAIAAVTSSNGLAWFSNYGSGSVHVGSPGVSITSTVPVRGSTKYGTMSGTSMASPFVSGTAAMMAYNSSSMNGYQMRSIIFEEADIASSLNGYVSTRSKLDSASAITRSKTESVVGDLPVYSFTNNDRAVASSLAGGCGTVSKMASNFTNSQKPSGGAPATWYFIVLAAILVLPMAMYQYLRTLKPVQRRKFDRFNIDSSVTVALGDKKLVGNISSISMGGVQLNTEALLEKGGTVTLSIASPDGSERIQVEGHVVWSEERKSYGVQFSNAKQSALDRIGDWTKNLVKQAG